MGQIVPQDDLPVGLVPQDDLPESIRNSGFPSTPGGAAVANPNLLAQGGAFGSLPDDLSSRDPGIDYHSGIPSAKLRVGLSFMKGDAEKENFLNRKVGKDNYGKDSFGAYYIKPEGLKKLGLKSRQPVAINEQRTTGYDVADIAGDVPAIAGAVGGGIAASGAGLLPGLALSGIAAAGGEAYSELGKNLLGYRQRPAEDIAMDIAKEGGMAMTGEAGARALMPLGRAALGPGASRMTPAKQLAADEARNFFGQKPGRFGPVADGFKVRAGAVTDAPILARWEGMVRQIFGDIHGEQNLGAAQKGLTQLSDKAGASLGKEATGEAVVNSIRASRVQFGEDMAGMYSKVDEIVGGPFVSTQPLKDTAESIINSVPKTKGGEVAFLSPETKRFLGEITDLEDTVTSSQMQRVRTLLREASDSNDLVPGISKHDARSLRKAADKALSPDNATGQAQEALTALRIADRAYAKGIKRFDNSVVSSIARNARQGQVDPDMVVDHIIKPERAFRVREIKNVVSTETWAKVKSAHAEDLISNIIQKADDPLQTVFDGKAFRNALDKYGRKTLDEVHGKEWVDGAYKYANALMLSSKTTKMSGGIVAANIALHPVKNLPKLIWIRLLAKVIEQPATFNYLTRGVQAPKTKAGAAALTRFGTQIMALAEEETGAARFTLTNPEPPQ